MNATASQQLSASAPQRHAERQVWRVGGRAVGFVHDLCESRNTVRGRFRESFMSQAHASNVARPPRGSIQRPWSRATNSARSTSLPRP